jgi:hypothetical protein
MSGLSSHLQGPQSAAFSSFLPSPGCTPLSSVCLLQLPSRLCLYPAPRYKAALWLHLRSGGAGSEESCAHLDWLRMGVSGPRCLDPGLQCLGRGLGRAGCGWILVPTVIWPTDSLSYEEGCKSWPGEGPNVKMVPVT